MKVETIYVLVNLIYFSNTIRTFQSDKLDTKSSGPLSGLSSDYEKQRGGGQSDSGRGSTVYSSGKLKNTTDTSPDSSELHRMAGKCTYYYNTLSI